MHMSTGADVPAQVPVRIAVPASVPTQSEESDVPAFPLPDLVNEWRLWWELILTRHRHAPEPGYCSCGKPCGDCIFRVMAYKRGILHRL